MQEVSFFSFASLPFAKKIDVLHDLLYVWTHKNCPPYTAHLISLSSDLHFISCLLIASPSRHV